MAAGAAARAPRTHDRRRPPDGGGRRSPALLRDFCAPDYGSLVRWPGFASLTRTAQAVLEYLCSRMDGRGSVVLPAREVGLHLCMSIRSVRSAYSALRLSGLILTTETQNARGGTYQLWIRPGPVLLKLAPSPKKAAFFLGSDRRGFRGANSSPPYPVRGEIASSLNTPSSGKSNRNIEVAREALKIEASGRGPPERKEDAAADSRCAVPPPSTGPPCEGPAAPRARRRRRLPSPRACLVAAMEAALGSGGSLTPADRRLLRVVAPIALEHGVEAVAVNVCRYAGRVRWSTCRGALVRQRFVDALELRGLGDDAVPPRWQKLRRRESVRVDRAEPLTRLHDDVPPAPAGEPETVGSVLTGDFRELLRMNGVQLEDRS